MKRSLTIVFLLAAALSAAAQQKTYFVSPSGNDAASGLSIAQAWKSLDKVNATVFQPGDKILFEGGKTWYGQLDLKGSGTAEAPILLASYGEGRPVINLGRAEGAGILLHNQGGWTICGFEVTSGAPAELGVTRQGINVRVDGSGLVLSDVTVRDCFIHDIWGQIGGVRERSSAILVSCNGPRAARGESVSFAQPSLSNVLVEGNRIERVDKTGIVTNSIREGLRVRRNYMDNLGGDGIIVSGSYRALIEYNEIHRSCLRTGYLDLPGDQNWWPHVAACWIIRCEETIMQFNEVYDTGREPKNGDGFAYDFDFYCKRCIAQYNYSRDNFGFLLLMYDIFQNVARYNISENDKTHLVQMQGSLKDDGNVLYNNVFYVDHGTLDLDFFRGDYPESAKDIDKLGAHFYNNIFYATGQGRFRTAYSTGETMVRQFDEVSKPTSRRDPSSCTIAISVRGRTACRMTRRRLWRIRSSWLRAPAASASAPWADTSSGPVPRPSTRECMSRMPAGVTSLAMPWRTATRISAPSKPSARACSRIPAALPSRTGMPLMRRPWPGVSGPSRSGCPWTRPMSCLCVSTSRWKTA